MVYRSTERLLLRAEAELNHITAESPPAEAFLYAHMAALRAAAAVVQAHGPFTAPVRRRRVRSVWEQMSEVSASWEPWAGRFAQQARERAAIESGRPTALTGQEAEGAVAAATEFVALARASVQSAGVPTRLAS